MEDLEFEAALNLLKPIVNENDPRLMDLNMASERLIAKVEAERDETYRYVNSVISKALAHEKVYDYDSGLQILKKLPEKLRNLVVKVDNESKTVSVIQQAMQKQKTDYTSKRNRLQMDIKQAEQLLKDLQFEAALDSLKVIVNDKEPRLIDLKMTSERLIAKVEVEREETYRYVSSILSKAIEYEMNYDYESAFQILDCYYETAADLGERDTPIRNLKIQGYSESINTAYNRIKPLAIEVYGLDKFIQKLICEGDLERTLFAIDELLALQPNRKDLIDLKSQLRLERDHKMKSVRDESYEIAKRLFSEQDYDSCLEQLDRIDVTVRNREIDELDEMAYRNKKRLTALYKEIKERIKVKDIDGLLVEVNELIALKSDDTSILKLRDQLIERDSKDGEKSEMLLQEAISLRDECRFAEAVSALSQIAPRMKSGAIEEMIVESNRFAELRKEAILKMEKAVGLENRRDAIVLGEQYLSLLSFGSLNDLEFRNRADKYRKLEVFYVILRVLFFVISWVFVGAIVPLLVYIFANGIRITLGVM